MKNYTHIETPIAIDRPMIITPADEYMELLKEAGYGTTPALNREIAQARARFRKGKYVPWKKLKNELL